MEYRTRTYIRQYLCRPAIPPTLQWGVNLSLPLFDGLSTPRQVAYARLRLQRRCKQLEAVRDNVGSQRYCRLSSGCFIKRTTRRRCTRRHFHSDELTRRKAFLKQGKIPEIDMLEAESQLAQDRMSVATSANDTRLALVDLALASIYR